MQVSSPDWNMSSRGFRRNQGPKPQTTFISLHFNKSDEEQLEISYKKGTEEGPLKNALDVSQSNFYIADSKESSLKGHYADSKEPSKDPSLPSVQPKPEPKAEEGVDFQSDLSPALEADEDTLSRDINNLLEKATCETLDLKKDTLSEPEEEPYCRLADVAMDSKSTDSNPVPHKGDSYFNLSVKKSIAWMRCARNSVTCHLFIALLAFVWAPLPSWLSGFLVGALLSSSLVYGLYKPRKKRRNLYGVSPSIACASHFQEESGILKVSWLLLC